MNSIKVEAKRKVLNTFRKEAKRLYPCEAYAFLLGHRVGDCYEVLDIWIPPDVADYSTTQDVTIPEKWNVEAHCEAEDRDLAVIGDIHSHPLSYAKYGGWFQGEPTPSSGDWVAGWTGLAAICAVCQQSDGTGRYRAGPKLLTRTKFYGPAAAVVSMKIT